MQKLFRVFMMTVRVHKLFVKATDIKRTRSATIIQKHCRRVLARKEAALRRVVSGVARMRSRAISTIQRLFRVKKLRNRIHYLATCNRIYSIRHDASVTIQKVAMGYIVRSDLHFLKHSAKLVKWPSKAKTVKLVGSFTRRPWKEEIPMTYSKYAKIFWTDYFAKHYVSPGLYHIKFIVDGKLLCDDKLPVAQDQFGTFSNIVDVGKRFPQIGSFDKLASFDSFQQQLRKESDHGEGIVRSFSGNLDSNKFVGISNDDGWMSDRELKLELASYMAAHPKSQFQPLSPEGSADAVFIDTSTQAFGIADGVGEWERHGIDASRFSHELMKRARAQLTRGLPDVISAMELEEFMRAVLTQSYEQTQSIGSSTELIGICKFSKLFTLILGDSCLLILRRRKAEEAKLTRVFRSKEQQHFFNCPFQLLRLPRPEEYEDLNEKGFGQFIKYLEKEKRSASLAKFDTPADAQFFSITLRPGDILIAGSDGLFDNLFDFEIKKLALRIDEAGLQPYEFCSRLAHELVAQAAERGFDTNFISPFAKAAKRAKRNYIGGKLDDISVIVGKVVT